MLKCRDVSHIASDYLDHQLTWRQQLSVRMHLLMCVHCRRFVNQLRLTGKTAATLVEQEASTDEIERILRHVLEVNKSERSP
jgi:predicted anti-sigma-YlaC factor YlaD